jgi:hypothetical protein
MSPTPTAVRAHPTAASVPLVPGPVPPPVAGAPTGALVVALGIADAAAGVLEVAGALGEADAVASVETPVGVLAVVAVPMAVAELAWGSQRHPSLSSQVITLPSPATPEIPWSVVRQNSPGS